jgi:hypothetical protein
MSVSSQMVLQNPTETLNPFHCGVPLGYTPIGRAGNMAECLEAQPYLGFLFHCYSDP